MQISINLVLVIITVLVSLGGFSSKRVLDDLIFYPPAITQRGQWYRFFSCGLIHADVAHLLFNMLALYLFGEKVEETFIGLFGPNGRWLYLGMYLSALLMSLLPTYLRHRDDDHYRSLGASGAVSAVVFAYIVFYPMSKIGFFILPPIIPGFIFGPLYLLLSAWLDKRGTDNINHSAHIWGALYGLLFVSVACPLGGFPVWQEFIDTIRGGM